MESLKIKKIILKIGLFAILAVIILPTLKVSAAGPQPYTVLAPLPGLPSTLPADNPLGKYIPFMFELLIGLSAVAAVLNIVIGGFQYMSTDAIQGKSAGKERVKNAVLGLVLVIGAWLILYTINPKLLELNLEIKPVITTAPNQALGELSTAGVPMTSDQIFASNAVRVLLDLGDVSVYRDPCTNGQTTQCVNLNGLTSNTTSGLLDLKDSCGASCSVVITGGTEGGHAAGSDHYKGTTVDIRSTDARLNEYIATHSGDPVQINIGQKYTVDIGGGKTAYFTYESATEAGSTGTHWHVTFP